MKLVHKNPALDLVGWYSLVPRSGPSAVHLPIHQQISEYNESAVLLGFHIEDMLNPASGDPLPITIYESNMEAEDRREEEGEDKEMKDVEAPANMVLRFRKLPYTTETGEAEMIAMQFVREGGANASADSTEKHILEQFDKKVAVDDGKGKRRAVAYKDSSSSKTKKDAAEINPDANLTRSEAEYMASLQAKFNAIKMMKSRLALVITYLQRLSPDFTAGNQTTAEAADLARASNGVHTIPSNTILRHIQALVTNADLVSPEEQSTLEREINREANDVKLVGLIAELMSSVSEVREAGRKFHALELSKQNTRPLGRQGSGLSHFDPAFLLGRSDSGLSAMGTPSAEI